MPRAMPTIGAVNMNQKPCFSMNLFILKHYVAEQQTKEVDTYKGRSVRILFNCSYNFIHLKTSVIKFALICPIKVNGSVI